MVIKFNDTSIFLQKFMFSMFYNKIMTWVPRTLKIKYLVLTCKIFEGVSHG